MFSTLHGTRNSTTKRRPSKWEQCQFFPKKASSKPSKFFKTEPTPQPHIYNLLEVILSYESHIIHLLRDDLRMGYPAQTITNAKLHKSYNPKQISIIFCSLFTDTNIKYLKYAKRKYTQKQ